MSDKAKIRRSRRRNPFVDVLNGILMLVVLAIVIAGGLLLWGIQQFNAPGPTAEATTFQVERGNGLSTVAARLEEAGVVDSRWVFLAGAVALKQEGGIRTGEYAIPPHASMARVLKELTEGTPITYSVTIPEGFTSWQVVQRLDATKALTGTIDTIPDEGSLLPDTYSFERGDARKDLIARMQKAQKTALEEIWANRAPDLPLKTPEDLVTLASIVEKETGVPNERAHVASVFYNRMEKGMRLQSDPTTIYGITHGKGPLGRGLEKAEIEQKNDYNTYQIEGLPAGPIDNPGRAAMEAVAHPADSKDLYFVAAGALPSDGHLFAETYAQHRKNVDKWRAIEKQVAIEAAKKAKAAEEAAKAAASPANDNEADDDTGTNATKDSSQ